MIAEADQSAMQARWMRIAVMARIHACDAEIHALKYVLWSHAARIAVEHGWILRRGTPALETLALLVRDEFVSGRVMNDIEKIGRLRITVRDWHRTWQQRYASLAVLPVAWLNAGGVEMRC